MGPVRRSRFWAGGGHGVPLSRSIPGGPSVDALEELLEAPGLDVRDARVRPRGRARQALRTPRTAPVRKGVLGPAGRRHVAPGMLEEGREADRRVPPEARPRTAAGDDHRGDGTSTKRVSRRTSPGGEGKTESLTLIALESGETNGQIVRLVRKLKCRGSNSLSKIMDHSSGERRVFNTSFSVFRRVGESREDVSDIVHPTVVRVT